MGNDNIVAISCANLIKIGPVTPEILRLTTAVTHLFTYLRFFGRNGKNWHVPPNILYLTFVLFYNGQLQFARERRFGGLTVH